MGNVSNQSVTGSIYEGIRMIKYRHNGKLYILLIIAISISLDVTHGNETILINEVELDPPCDNRHNDCLEWVELYNYGDKAIDISGWIVSSSDSFKVQDGIIIQPKRFFCVSKFHWLSDESANISLYNITSIIDRIGPFNDHISDSGDSCTWSRCPDGNDSWSFIIGSKNAINNCGNKRGL